MRIKKGDKVRVSGHYMAMMITDGMIQNALENTTFVVENIHKNARMAYVSCKIPICIMAPISGIGKVGKTANEELQEEYARFMSGRTPIPFADAKERTYVYSQPDFLKDFDPMEPTYEVTVDNFSINWPRYEADLAKEIVLKTVNCASDKRPSAVAQYATDIAKAVVENLKKK